MIRTRQRTQVSRAWTWLLLLGALVSGSLVSCDNPACVFAVNGCQTLAEGGANAVSATFPATGEWVIPNQPKISAVFPSGFAHPQSPVVIVFSESISPGSIQGAFTVQPTSGFGGGGLGSPPGGIDGGGGGALTAELVGDGRVLVLLPAALIAGTEYKIAFAEKAAVRDLSGALLPMPADGLVGTFTVDDAPAAAPELLMSWPLDGATAQSTISEVVTIFDRAINPITITASSWHVLVNGIPPTFDSLPESLSVEAPTGGMISDPRVWTWKSIDPVTMNRAELGPAATVTLELSSGLTKIATTDMVEMVAVTPSFTTFAASPPSFLTILSDPTDAIGIENLNGVNPLMIQVDLTAPAEEGDVLEIFLVGTKPPAAGTTGSDSDLLSRQREVVLSGGAVSIVLQPEDLLLTTSTVPLTSHFKDGEVAFGFAIRRGSLRTPLRVLDVDPEEDGIQDALLDLVPPTFVALIDEFIGGTTWTSDLRELSISGFGSEELRTVEVVANLMGGAVDNRIGGNLPPLPASNESGLFHAAPVPVGQVDPAEMPVDVGVILYDRALNASAPYILSYTQRGTIGTGLALLGSGLDVQVRVFDAVTLEPVMGARLYSHESVGGAVTAFMTAPVDTDAAGFGQIQSAPTGETLITVEAPGYDLFTFQAVPTTRLDVPLTPAAIAVSASTHSARSTGQALSSPFVNNWSADSRVLLPGDTVRLASAVNFNAILNTTIIGFPPLSVRSGEVGLATFLATKNPSDLTDPDVFSAGTFLQAFELEFPRAPLTPGGFDAFVTQVGALLSGTEVDPADIPLGTAPQVFSKPPNYALDFSNPMGEPRVSVEAFTPGVHGTMTIGLGLAYFNGGLDAWHIRAGFSARAKATGELVQDLTIENERYLRCEVVDASGNRSGVRQALSTATGTMAPPSVALLSAPTGTTAGDAYDLVYDDVIAGSQDTLGLYRVLLLDDQGKRWHLWTIDPAFTGTGVVTHVPPISAQGGTPLDPGPIAAVISSWSWPGFDPTDLMYTDIARRHDRFSSSTVQVFAQP